MMNFAAKFHETSPGCAAFRKAHTGWVLGARRRSCPSCSPDPEVEPVLDELLDLGVAAGFLATELVAGSRRSAARGDGENRGGARAVRRRSARFAGNGFGRRIGIVGWAPPPSRASASARTSRPLGPRSLSHRAHILVVGARRASLARDVGDEHHLALELGRATSLPSMSFADRSGCDMARGATVQARRDARAETPEVRGACASAVRAERRPAHHMRAAR